MWDVVLFLCMLSVPFLIVAARWLSEWRTESEAGVGLKRCDSYYMEGNRREETVKLQLHKFLRKPDTESAEGSPITNILSGCVVALASLPEAVSFSLMVGVSPLNGVWAGAVMSLCTAIVGGRPGLISSCSVAYAVVLTDITKDSQLGLGVMSVAVIISGMLQSFIGVLRVSRFASLIPQTVILGIINGLAIVTACSQIDHFRKGGSGTPFLEEEEMFGMMLTAFVSFVAACIWPRLPVVG